MTLGDSMIYHSSSYNEMIKKGYKVKGLDCEFFASLGSEKSIRAFYENCRMIKYR